jgi:metallo-beta-lactamase class B
MVYADSLTPVSSGPFRFLGDARHPDVSVAFRRSIDTVRNLPCDIMLSTHPEASGLFERLDRRAVSPAPDPLVDKSACRTLADKADRLLDERLRTERSQKPE